MAQNRPLGFLFHGDWLEQVADVSDFGRLLRECRQHCVDPNRPGRPLTQERLGELLGGELNISAGFSGAAVSDWERGASKIYADDRLLLVSLLKVLCLCGGITNLVQSNALLAAGNYRALGPDEAQIVFPDWDNLKDESSEPRNVPGKVIWPAGIPDEPYIVLPNREQSLEEMLGFLKDRASNRVISVDGLGGLGKTALAAELVRRAIGAGLYEGVIGETAKQEILGDEEIIQLRDAVLDYEGLLDTLARQLQRWDLFTMGLKDKEAVLGRILRQRAYLLFIDNLETAENANALVARIRDFLGPSRAIVTSRLQVRLGFVRSFTLDGLKLNDSVFFLRSLAKGLGADQISDADDGVLSEIHEITGGSPLALKLVAAQAKFLSLDQILAQLRKTKSELFPFIFLRSWEQLSATAQSILVYVGRTVVETVGVQELALAELASDDAELLSAIDQLVAYSLLNVSYSSGQMRYGIHQLTRQFVVSDLPRIWREQGLL